ncbi:MAG: cyclic nucleotide-binding domain-containing protein [Sphingomonadales bacterium]|nr:cyclic nucleotide-binding domain-containing protein [Sphingomonadales bacterium]
MSHVSHHAIETDRYAKCIEVSKRIRWDTDRDVIRGRQFDFAKPFLPDGLSKASQLGFLSTDEKRLFSQVQGRSYANMFALVGAIFLVATLLMQTIVALRVTNMVGCMFFAAFGALSGNVGTFILYFLFLPINAIRLRQMLNLIKRARVATEGDTSLEWLKPFMTERKYKRGEKLCKKDDVANEMFLTVTGKFLVKEIGVEIPPGRLVGELGFLTPNQRRTATVECIENAQVMTITYERLLEIYFQNPQFGYYFLVLTSQRLLENISRLEGIVAQERAARAALATDK